MHADPLALVAARAVKPAPDEMAAARQWTSTAFGERPPAAPPFSFTFGGRSSSELLTSWKAQRTTSTLDGQRTQHTLTWTDAATGLALRCVVVEYLDFPTVEWTLHFKNTGKADTPILEGIQALDVQLQRGATGEFLLHHSVGSQARLDDYRPLETRLDAGSTRRYAACGGRPTDLDMPYYNLEMPGGEGVIVVIGWPGQWAAEFARDAAAGLRIRAGQELTRFKLLPGEDVRTPLVVLQFWKGDWVRSQNIWRRWMLAHNLPRPGGKLPEPLMSGYSGLVYGEMVHATEENQKMFIDRYIEEGLDLDYWWMDAGWYVHQQGWPQTGTWEVDTKRFPNGLRAISDYAHSKGMKTLVWFEPERVAPGTWLYEKHPEWLLGVPKQLLNLGNPEAWHWLVEHMDTLLVEQVIDLYRQDFNIVPLDCWRANDAEDRQGITEIRHVTGYLAFWDELRRRHPEMLIDSCASGGRRNDLETMRRAVPLWRTDYPYEPLGSQSMTYGLSFWLPYHGTGTVARLKGWNVSGEPTPVEPYGFLSDASCPSIMCGFDMRVREVDYGPLRTLFAQRRQISACYLGDYYPLTSYSLAHDVWIAWQFDRPEAGDGLIEAFRREQSVYETARLRLRGLDPDARYDVTRLGEDSPRRMTGCELTDDGLVVGIASAPGVAVYQYRRVN